MVGATGYRHRVTFAVLRFSCLSAETLQDRYGIVTDAVNRKKDGVGAAHDPGEQPLTFLHATIVVQKFSLRLFNKGPNTAERFSEGSRNHRGICSPGKLFRLAL